MEYMPNRFTLLYSKIYYKEENYLKVRTTVFKYITPRCSIYNAKLNYILVLSDYNIEIFKQIYY